MAEARPVTEKTLWTFNRCLTIGYDDSRRSVCLFAYGHSGHHEGCECGKCGVEHENNLKEMPSGVCTHCLWADNEKRHSRAFRPCPYHAEYIPAWRDLEVVPEAITVKKPVVRPYKPHVVVRRFWVWIFCWAGLLDAIAGILTLGFAFAQSQLCALIMDWRYNKYYPPESIGNDPPDKIPPSSDSPLVGSNEGNEK